jgi:hypothetical protein
MRGLAVFIMLSAIGACAETPSDVYRPEVASSVVAASLPSSRAPVPPERPQGTIEVASSGITQLHLANGDVSALQVRLVVTNDGDSAAWQLDTREQYVEIPGEGRSRAMYVRSDVQTLPVAAIARRERHVFDLYFALPPDETRLTRFDVEWQVTTPRRIVASRTAFDRVSETPQVTYGGYPEWPYWVGYGPYWWYDSSYPAVVFAHAHPVVARDHRPPVMVGRFHGHFAPDRSHAT